jgi:hypothetical protein
MATAAQTVPPKTQPVPPPAVQAQAAVAPPAPPAAVPSAPPLPQPFAPSRLMLAEHALHPFVISCKPNERFEDFLDPARWANCANRMRPGDRVEVQGLYGANRFWANLLVLDAQEANVRTGAKGGCLVHVLQFVEIPPQQAIFKARTSEVRFLGGHENWAVVRIADQAVLAANLPNREEAEKHLAGMIRTGMA